MKKQLFILTSVILFSCFFLTSTAAPLDGIVTDFLQKTSSIEEASVGQPIVAFTKEAETKAAKKIALTKDNAESVWAEAKNYKHCVIVTGNHTIVKVTDLEDCRASGSWGTCMPKGEGYVKKGSMTFMQDYVNMIMGRPDSQTRTVYLFK